MSLILLFFFFFFLEKGKEAAAKEKEKQKFTKELSDITFLKAYRWESFEVKCNKKKYKNIKILKKDIKK